MNIKLKDADKIRILNSTDIYSIMQKVLLRENKIDRNKEHFWTIGLDTAHRVLYVELISLGGTRSTFAEPMQVYRVAVLKGSVKIILIHNHPSGTMIASEQDLEITDKLIQVGKILGVEVEDHLIISEKSYISMADNGTLDELQQSKKYVPDYKKIEEFEAQIEKEIREDEKMMMAKMMKAKGEPIKKIAEYTGLSIETIKEIKITK